MANLGDEREGPSALSQEGRIRLRGWDEIDRKAAV